MILSSVYNTRLLISSIWISYTLAICMLGLLALRFFYWFMTNRNIVVLLYGLATAFIAISAGISLFLSTLLPIGQSVDTTANSWAHRSFLARQYRAAKLLICYIFRDSIYPYLACYRSCITPLLKMGGKNQILDYCQHPSCVFSHSISVPIPLPYVFVQFSSALYICYYLHNNF